MIIFQIFSDSRKLPAVLVEQENWEEALDLKRGGSLSLTAGSRARVEVGRGAVWQSARLSCCRQPAMCCMMMMMAPKPTAMVSETDDETAVVGACICLLLDTLPP